MSKVGAAIEIDAPVEEVFRFFDDVTNAAVVVPALVEITSIEPLDGGGRRVEYSLRTAKGALVGATSEHLEHDPPRRTVTRSVQSGVQTTSTREFVATADGATRVVATVEWSVPVKLVAGIVTAPLRGPYRRSLRQSLAAAKAAIESGVTRPSG
jgi:uncharacterized membrane protein